MNGGPSSRSPRELAACRGLVAGGRLVEAEVRLGGIVRDGSGGTEAPLLLGIVLARAGRWDEAGERFDAVLGEDPAHPEALTWAAATRRAQGRFEEAALLLRRLLERRPDDPEAHNLLGSCLLAQGQGAEAERAFRTALRLRADDAAAHANLGMALRLQNRGEEALVAFRTARDLDSARATNHLQLFKQLQQLSRWDEAVEALQTGLRRHPRSVLLSEALAVVYGRLGRAKEAERIFRDVSPIDASAASSYADWLQQVGRFEDSIPVLRKSLELQPLQGAPYRLLAEARQDELNGKPMLKIALELAKRTDLVDVERMHLSYAAGRLHERETDFEAAMEAFDRANEIAYRTYPLCRTFDPEWTRREPELVAGLYSRSFLERIASLGVADTRPIFIVGMIRSGTTLLDQIVSSHPKVDSVGEGGFWNAEADAIHPRWNEESPTRSEVTRLAERYLSAVRATERATPFTDKMPLNYRHLGLIHAVFPRARILHIRRNPLDTCLSIYSTFFGGSANFVYRKENIMAFYRAYRLHMEHWRQVLPANRMLELDYEALVTDPSPSTRQVIDFLDLPWDEACLRPDRNASAIHTPSRWQARQPVYSSSIGKWRLYEPWLGELAELRAPDSWD